MTDSSVSGLRQPGTVCPEGIRGCARRALLDIYSLGETLWFALTGKAPFAGRTLSEIHRAQKSNALPLNNSKQRTFRIV